MVTTSAIINAKIKLKPKTKTIFGDPSLSSCSVLPMVFIHALPNTFGLYQINPIGSATKAGTKIEKIHNVLYFLEVEENIKEFF